MANTWNQSPPGRRHKTNVRRHRRDEYLDGKVCVECGRTDKLTVSWIERPGPFPTSCIWGWSAERQAEYLAKCRVVCFTCVRKAAAERRKVGHGEGARGVAGCNCVPCATRRKAYLHDRYLIRKRNRP